MLRIEAYERFKDKLLSGEIRPGSFLTQKEIAELAGVQLGPAREAILRLAHENLLKIHAKKGVQVVEISLPLIRQAYEIREMIELRAIRRFTRTARDDEIADLIDATRAIAERAKGGIDKELEAEATELDWRTHDTFVASLDNPLIAETYHLNQIRIRLVRQSNRLDNERLPTAMQEHLDLLGACAAREEERAATLLAEHIDISRTRAINGR